MLRLQAQAATPGFYVGAGVTEIWIQVLVFVQQLLLLWNESFPRPRVSFLLRKCIYACFYVCTCSHVQMCNSTCVDTRGQRVEVSFLFPQCGSSEQPQVGEDR